MENHKSLFTLHKIGIARDVLSSTFFYRKHFCIDDILKKYYDRDGPRDVARCKQKVEKSLSMFAKVASPDKDFMTEIETEINNFQEEMFHLTKVSYYS